MFPLFFIILLILKKLSFTEASKETRDLFQPRMDYEQWTPLGRGDPLKNDPTYDYVPPVLERVHYWIDPALRKPDPSLPGDNQKKEILVLGVSSKKTSTGTSLSERRDVYDPFLKFVEGPKFNLQSNYQRHRPNYQFPNLYHTSTFFGGGKNKIPERSSIFGKGEQKIPYTVLMPPPVFKTSGEVSQKSIDSSTEKAKYKGYFTTSSSVSVDEASLIYHSSSVGDLNEWNDENYKAEQSIVFNWRTPTPKPFDTKEENKQEKYSPAESFIQFHQVFNKSINNTKDKEKIHVNYKPQLIVLKSDGSDVMIKGQVTDDNMDIESTYVNIGKPEAQVDSSTGLGVSGVAIKPPVLMRQPPIVMEPILPLTNYFTKADTPRPITLQTLQTMQTMQPPPLLVTPRKEKEKTSSLVNLLKTEVTSPYAKTSSFDKTTTMRTLPIGNTKPIIGMKPIVNVKPYTNTRPDLKKGLQNSSTFNFKLFDSKLHNKSPFNASAAPYNPRPDVNSRPLMNTKPIENLNLNTIYHNTNTINTNFNARLTTQMKSTTLLIPTVIPLSTVEDMATKAAASTSQSTTVSSLTTDPLFKHYKQPSEPIKGPMYLIIQGHSKVKTYGPKKYLHGIPIQETNEIPTAEDYGVKHLHFKKIEIPIEKSNRLGRSSDLSLKHVVQTGLGAIDFFMFGNSKIKTSDTVEINRADTASSDTLSRDDIKIPNNFDVDNTETDRSDFEKSGTLHFGRSNVKKSHGINFNRANNFEINKDGIERSDYFKIKRHDDEISDNLKVKNNGIETSKTVNIEKTNVSIIDSSSSSKIMRSNITNTDKSDTSNIHKADIFLIELSENSNFERSDSSNIFNTIPSDISKVSTASSEPNIFKPISRSAPFDYNSLFNSSVSNSRSETPEVPSIFRDTPKFDTVKTDISSVDSTIMDELKRRSDENVQETELVASYDVSSKKETTSEKYYKGIVETARQLKENTKK